MLRAEGTTARSIVLMRRGRTLVASAAMVTLAAGAAQAADAQAGDAAAALEDRDLVAEGRAARARADVEDELWAERATSARPHWGGDPI